MRDNTIKVDGQVRLLLREVIERMGPNSVAGRRASGILRSGSKYMSRRVLIDYARIVTGA